MFLFSEVSVSKAQMFLGFPLLETKRRYLTSHVSALVFLKSSDELVLG